MVELEFFEVRVGLYKARFRARAVSILGLDFHPSGFSVRARIRAGLHGLCVLHSPGVEGGRGEIVSALVQVLVVWKGVRECP